MTEIREKKKEKKGLELLQGLKEVVHEERANLVHIPNEHPNGEGSKRPFDIR